MKMKTINELIISRMNDNWKRVCLKKKYYRRFGVNGRSGNDIKKENNKLDGTEGIYRKENQSIPERIE